MNEPCPVCNSEKTEALANPPWWRCTECGLGFMREEARIKRVQKLSKDGYGKKAVYAPMIDADHKAKVAERILMGWNALHGRGDIVKGPVGRMVEVGFGNGAIMDEFKRQGWGVTGVDQSSLAVEQCQARGLHVARGQFDEPDNGSENSVEWGSAPYKQPGLVLTYGQTDIVIGWDAFEHLFYLEEAFKLAGHLLIKGGVLAVHSPNFDRYKDNPKHPHFQDESHLWHMTPRAATILAMRARLILGKVEKGECWGEPGYAHPDNFVLWGVEE